LPRYETLRFVRAVLLRELAMHQRSRGLGLSSAPDTDRVSSEILGVVRFLDGACLDLMDDRESRPAPEPPF
jgi:hypothetical protein